MTGRKQEIKHKATDRMRHGFLAALTVSMRALPRLRGVGGGGAGVLGVNVALLGLGYAVCEPVLHYTRIQHEDRGVRNSMCAHRNM